MRSEFAVQASVRRDVEGRTWTSGPAASAAAFASAAAAAVAPAPRRSSSSDCRPRLRQSEEHDLPKNIQGYLCRKTYIRASCFNFRVVSLAMVLVGTFFMQTSVQIRDYIEFIPVALNVSSILLGAMLYGGVKSKKMIG